MPVDDCAKVMSNNFELPRLVRALGMMTVAPELSVEVATKQDGSDATQWDRRSSLTHDIYKHVRIVQ